MKTELKRSDISAEGRSFAIVVARWNDDFTSKLADGALEALLGAGGRREDIDVFHVPGAFELPVASLKTAASGEYDAVIALGVVIRGDTPHFDYVAGQAAAGLMQASIQTGVPVMFGVITMVDIGGTDGHLFLFTGVSIIFIPEADCIIIYRCDAVVADLPAGRQVATLWV